MPDRIGSTPHDLWWTLQHAREQLHPVGNPEQNEADRLIVGVQVDLLGEDESAVLWNARRKARGQL